MTENPNIQGNDRNGYLRRIKRLSDQNELNRLFYILKKSLPAMLGIVLLFAIISYGIIRWTSPIYEASSIIQLGQNDKANKILEVNQLFEEDDLFAEQEFIQSPLLINSTVKNLPISIRYFNEGNFLTHEKYPNSFFKVDSLNIKDAKLYGKKIYIEFNNESNFSLEINGEIHENLIVNQYYDFEGISLSIDNNSANSNTNGFQKNYFKLYSNEMLVAEFKKQLRVSAYNHRAKSVLIKIRGQNPDLASDFINAHVQSYMTYSQERQNQSAENILEFITNQLDTVSKNLQDAERLLASFKSKNNFTGQASSSIFDNLDEYDNEIVELEFQENILKELETLTNLSNEETDVYNLMAQLMGSNYEVVLKGMMNELTDLLKAREEYKYSITEENERIKTINYQIGIQKKLIQESIASLSSKLAQKKKLLLKKKDLVETQFVNIPAKEIELARYERLFKISEKYYNLLLEKQTEYKISKAGYVSNNKVLSKAHPDKHPIYPKKYKTYGTLIGLGLILSLVYGLIRFLTYDKINSLNDIVKYSGASIKTLGVIPKIEGYKGKNASLIIHPKKKTVFAESLRSIRTNLQFIKRMDGPKTIAVTSTVSGEGKTFIILNLGAVLSFSKKKAIILDLDLRKPKIHLGLNSSNEMGLSNLLEGNANIEDCIRKSKLENLDFITSGPLPVNPSEIINNGNLQVLLTELKKTYEYILIDTPPIGLVSDGFPILQLADYPIYVFKSEESKISYIQNVDRLIHENGLNYLTAILNNVNVKKSGYGYGYVGADANSGDYFDTENGKTKKRSFFN